jgi:sphingolipid delta-4 desaturase
MPTPFIVEKKQKLKVSKLTIPRDENSPLHLGEWERSLAWRDTDFARDWQTQPHTRRRKTILERHPLIRRLYSHDPMVAWIIVFGVGCNTLLAYFFGRTEGWAWFLVMTVVACVIGASIVDLMAVCVHECVHSLVTKDSLPNKLLALLSNVGTPVPIAMSFRRYHSDHHVYQGSVTKDPDMPLEWELRLIRGTFWHKLIWLTVYPVMYAVRAIFRGKTVTYWESVNTVFTIFCNIVTLYCFGVRGWAYTLICFLYGYTFHPVAAHFLQEHYTFTSGQETYNYYGWANALYLNIGFHNEHHDFPAVPARLLPMITKLAPEFYQPLKAHMSWRNVLWSFLTDANIGPQSRCART